MQPATQIAQSVLYLKSPRARAFTSELGRKQVGPRDYLSCMRMSKAVRFIKALAPEARRLYLAERRAKWLTDVIVHRDGRQIFKLNGIAPDGVPYDIHLELQGDASLADFLCAVMNDKNCPNIMRLDAAKTAASLMYEKPSARVVIERACAVRPKPAPRRSPEERMKIRRQQQAAWARRRRQSSVIATTTEPPAISNG
jgi:hypothetical protein